MKKLILILLVLFASSYVFAESPQLQYIKEIYKESIRLEGRETKDNQDYYIDYFDEITSDMACIDHDVLWQRQDFNPKAKLTFTKQSKDKVKVTIGATKGFEERSVVYQVKCYQSNRCKITKVFEEGKPFTKETKECLDNIYHKNTKKINLLIMKQYKPT